jgi:hypothetical protein
MPTDPPNTEDLEAAIIRTVYGGGYAHAENILHRFEHLKRRMPHDAAIALIYAEVTDT